MESRDGSEGRHIDPDIEPFIEHAAEYRELFQRLWLRYPLSVREEIVTLISAGWRLEWDFHGHTGRRLVHPQNEEYWISFDLYTFERTISGELAWHIDEEAGRCWWTHEQWPNNPK